MVSPGDWQDGCVHRYVTGRWGERKDQRDGDRQREDTGRNRKRNGEEGHMYFFPSCGVWRCSEEYFNFSEAPHRLDKL